MECPVGDESVESRWESLLSDGGVESDLCRDDWVSSEESRVIEELVVVVLALSSDDKVELEDWMGHVELDVLEVGLVLSVLVLDDDGVEWRKRELVSFLGVYEDAHDEERGGDIGGGDFSLGSGVKDLDVWSRDDDESLEVLDTEGDVHVGEEHGRGGDGLSWRSGVEERDWHIVLGLFLGSVDEFVSGVVFADHLEESFAWLSRDFLPDVEVIGGDDVDGLLVEENGNGLGKSLSSGIHPVSPEWSRIDILGALIRLGKLVGALVHLGEVVVDSRLDSLGLGTSTWIRKRLEECIVLAGACLVAVLGDGESASSSTSHGAKTWSRVDHKGLVQVVGDFTDVGSQVKSSKSDGGVEAERDPLKRKWSEGSETLSPESERCLVVQNHAHADARVDLGENGSTDDGTTTLCDGHFFFFLGLKKFFFLRNTIQ